MLNKNHNFRENFENELRKGYTLHEYENKGCDIEKPKTPMVLIVVQGGLGTLKSILNALNNETPILLIAVSRLVVILLVEIFK